MDTDVVHIRIASPLGPLQVAACDGGLCRIVLPHETRMLPPEALPGRAVDRASAHPLLAEAQRQLDAYFAGQLQQFELPLAPQGTAFQLQVWWALADIPFGQTLSYAQLAVQLGWPRAVRAVGAANGRNPLPIVLPCHRVIGSDGSLTGFAAGLAAKAYLLWLEGSPAAGTASLWSIGEESGEGL